jgi:hypothetical protein
VRNINQYEEERAESGERRVERVRKRKREKGMNLTK